MRPGWRAFADSNPSEQSRKKPELRRTRFLRTNSSMAASGRLLVDRDVPEEVDLVQGPARAHHYRRQGIVGEHDGEPRFLAQQHVEIAEQRAAAGEHDAFVDDVG